MRYGNIMIETIKKEWQVKVAVVLLLALTVWWGVGLLHPDTYSTRYFGDYPSIYGVMALWGGFWGFSISKHWGGMKSVMGKAIIMFSLGLFAQEVGQIIYAYYSFVEHIAVPYPSLGDIGYFGSIPLYIYGVYLLAKASGATIKLQSYRHRIPAILIPLIMLALGYILFLQTYEFDFSNPIKIFLDFGYPFGQKIYISLAIVTYLLSKGVLGGVMKNRILFILFALFIQFLSDFTFLYQSSRGTWSVGGINDFMYLCAYFLMTLSLLQLATVLRKLK